MITISSIIKQNNFIQHQQFFLDGTTDKNALNSIQVCVTQLYCYRVYTSLINDHAVPLFYFVYSTADTCKSCTKRGKGLEFGTNETFILQIKN